MHGTLAVLGCLVCAYQTYRLTSGLTVSVWITLVIWIALGAVWFAIRYPTVRRLHTAREAAAATVTDSRRTITGTTEEESTASRWGSTRFRRSPPPMHRPWPTTGILSTATTDQPNTRQESTQ